MAGGLCMLIFAAFLLDNATSLAVNNMFMNVRSDIFFSCAASLIDTHSLTQKYSRL